VQSPVTSLSSSLAERIGPDLPPAAALSYLLEIATALARQHATGRVHGSLCPQCVLLQADGTLALTRAGRKPPRQHTPRTARYTSPESVRCEPLGERHDLYCLGVIAWEMLTGGAPVFEGKTALAVMCRHLSAPVPRLPIELMRFQPVLERLLAKSPAERYASAADLAEDLKARFPDVLSVPHAA